MYQEPSDATDPLTSPASSQHGRAGRGDEYLTVSFSPSRPSPGSPSYLSGSSESTVEVSEPRWAAASWTGHLELTWLSNET